MTKILIIDDNADNLISAKVLIKNLEPSFEVLTAQSGSEGIKLALSEQLDTILLDVQMPKMDGYEVCRRLRAEQKTNRIPIIFLTAIQTTSEDKIKGLEMGGDAYLTKPIEKGELLATIHTMLRIKKVEDELEKEKELLEIKVEERTKELLELNAKYLDSYDYAPDMFASVESKTSKILRCNQTLADALGYKKDEIIGQPIFFVYHPDCLEEAKKYFQQFVDTGEIHGAELQLKRKDGSKIEVRLNVSVVRDEYGKILYSSSIWRDITERKQAEEELSVSEKKYRTFFEKSTDAILIIENGMFVDCNQATVKMLKYNVKDELLQTHPSKLSPPTQPDGQDSVQKANEMMSIAISKGSNRFEWDHKRANGEVFPVEVLLTAITTETGNRIIHTVWRDITKRKQAEKEVIKLSNVIRTTDDMVFITDIDGNIEYANPSFEKITGYSVKEVIGQNPRILKSGKMDQEYYKKVWDSILSGKSISAEVVNRRKNGQIFIFDQTITPSTDKSGKITHFISTGKDATERKRSEKALRESKELFVDYFENAPVGFHIFGPDQIIMEINETELEIIGYTRDEIVGKKKWSDLIVKEQMPIFEEHWKQLLKGQRITDLEYTLVHKKGHLINVSLNASGRYDANGLLESTRGSIIDITERKRSKKALKESEKKYRTLTDHMDLGQVLHAADTRILFSNPGANNILGLSKEQMLGKKAIDPAWRFVRQDGSAMPIEEYPVNKVIISKKKLSGYVCGISRPDRDNITWVSVNAVPVTGKNDKLGYVSITFSNITDSRRAESILKESEKKFRNVIEQSNDGIYVLQKDKFVFINPRFTKITGYGYNQLSHKDFAFHSLFTDKGFRVIEKRNERRKLGKRLSGRFTFEGIHKNGKIRNWEVSITEIEWEGSNATLGVLLDVTERLKARRKLEKALEQASNANEVKNQFLANMSHEIRTPLNTILGFTELIKKSTKDVIGEEGKEFFEIVNTSGQRLMNTVHEILDISQIEAGSYVGKAKYFNLVDVTQLLVSGLQIKVKEKELKIEFQSILKNMQVFADRDGITQSISNILDNAIKYTIKGKITVSLTQKSKCPILTIEDTGVGMSKKYQDKIFEIFSQESEGYSKNYQGIGLGMSIVKRHLDLNQVKIVIKSTRGKGTAIILTFPRLEQGDGE